MWSWNPTLISQRSVQIPLSLWKLSQAQANTCSAASPPSGDLPPHMLFSTFIRHSSHSALGMGYLSPFLHAHIGLWTWRQGLHALLCMSLGTVHRICHYYAWFNQQMHEWIDGRKEQWCNVKLLPGESILMSPYWLWSLSLDQADTRLNNILFSLSFISWLTPPTFLKSGGWRLRDALKHEEIHLGHFWALEEIFSSVFSIQRGILQTPYAHT